MEERQRLKFTGTNSSIGLIVLIANAHEHLPLLSSRAEGAADGALDAQWLGSAGCWSDPGGAQDVF